MGDSPWLTKHFRTIPPTFQPQVLAKADKLVLVVERADEGKLRATCSAWSDPVVALAGECLALPIIERQAHAVRIKLPMELAALVLKEPAPPDPGEDDFEVKHAVAGDFLSRARDLVRQADLTQTARCLHTKQGSRERLSNTAQL